MTAETERWLIGGRVYQPTGRVFHDDSGRVVGEEWRLADEWVGSREKIGVDQ